jgi:hypothetical protein
LCQFTNIASSSTEGGGISLTLPSSFSFSLSSSSFTSCHSSTSTGTPTTAWGRGGGIFLSLLNDDSSLTFSQSISFSSNDATKGRDVYLVCENLTTVVGSSSSPFSFITTSIPDTENKRENSCSGRDEGEDMEEDWDLFFFFNVYKKEDVFVDEENGNDVDFCGISFIPCQHFSVVLSHLLPLPNPLLSPFLRSIIISSSGLH